MTNTNLMRCSRSPLSAAPGAVLDFPSAGSELLGGVGGLGLIAAVGPWSVRLCAGRRPAMEVYEYGELLDVVVESSLGDAQLRGARRGRAYGPVEGPVSCAWGRWPPGASPRPVLFRPGGLRRRAVQPDAVRTTGRFWFASAAGEFRWAQVCGPSARAEHPESGRAA
ncbi:hypothetical protein [Kitasatospora sp. CB01950]|uniref:hypothetical protein n=1 Tax=Kitasatospora sp. CB01950 TaxID=1703930 RepID=UPI00093F92CF|nr:hypothetical protein [Kitasatospora sp. CB01950]OKJ10356.1 hypothetical protein AMK19_16015 [Kitasatospora sp. CB01950]